MKWIRTNQRDCYAVIPDSDGDGNDALIYNGTLKAVSEIEIGNVTFSGTDFKKATFATGAYDAGWESEVTNNESVEMEWCRTGSRFWRCRVLQTLWKRLWQARKGWARSERDRKTLWIFGEILQYVLGTVR